MGAVLDASLRVFDHVWLSRHCDVIFCDGSRKYHLLVVAMENPHTLSSCIFDYARGQTLATCRSRSQSQKSSHLADRNGAADTAVLNSLENAAVNLVSHPLHLLRE